MALSNEQVQNMMKRLLLSRMRILSQNGFYGLLLMHMHYSIDETMETAATDGDRIIFGAEFLNDLSDSELDFIMMHEILHVVLFHCFRGKNYDQEAFNVACDIVVNSNILLAKNNDIRSITLEKYGVSIHLAPDGIEGHEYTAEQVYALLSQTKAYSKQLGKGEANNEFHDDHSRWKEVGDGHELHDLWVKRFEDACASISIRDPSNKRGALPKFAQRMLGELIKSRIDWRTILNNFVQEDVSDYSFFPPDQRYSEGPFFLPDYNEKEDSVKDILFMVDTSGSISDDMIVRAYSEIKGAIDQFNGKLQGWLGFFDAAIIEPKPFEDENELMNIKPAGGGGTDFGIIFDYVQKYMKDCLPSSIIIMTDGYAPFPKEEKACGIPVLWLLIDGDVEPPWGKVAHMNI